MLAPASPRPPHLVQHGLYYERYKVLQAVRRDAVQHAPGAAAPRHGAPQRHTQRGPVLTELAPGLVVLLLATLLLAFSSRLLLLAVQLRGLLSAARPRSELELPRPLSAAIQAASERCLAAAAVAAPLLLLMKLLLPGKQSAGRDLVQLPLPPHLAPQRRLFLRGQEASGGDAVGQQEPVAGAEVRHREVCQWSSKGKAAGRAPRLCDACGSWPSSKPSNRKQAAQPRWVAQHTRWRSPAAPRGCPRAGTASASPPARRRPARLSNGMRRQVGGSSLGRACPSRQRPPPLQQQKAAGVACPLPRRAAAAGGTSSSCSRRRRAAFKQP